MSINPEPASAFSTCIKIDGFFIISNSWNIWRPLKCPAIIFPLLVRKEAINRCIKGSRFFKDHDVRHVYLIKLFEVCDVTVNLTFFSGENEVSYTELIALSTLCLENAVNFLSSSETYSRKQQKVDQFVEKGKNAFLISLCDFNSLGERFALELNQAARLNNLELVFVSSATGQSQNLNYFDDKLSIENHQNVIEILYHVAIDNVQESKYLFWSKEGLSAILQRPSQQYFPNCIGKFGNFYFDINVPLDHSPFEITMIKAYSKCNSFCHDNPSPPFIEPNASNLFLKASTMSFRKQTKASLKKIENHCKRIKKEMELLKRITRDFLVQTSGVARFEAICSLNQSTQMRDAAMHCMDVIKQANVVTPETLYAISAETIKFRCESIFVPYVNLVDFHLEKLLQMLKPEPNLDFLDITVHDIITVEAGEAAIAFMLYGRSAETNVSRGHNYFLSKELGFVSKEFESANLPFPVLGKNLLHVDENERLVFVPNFNFLPLLDGKGFVNSLSLEKIFSLTAELSLSDNMPRLCEYILEKICLCIISTFGKYVRGVPTFSKTSVVIEKFPRRLILSSQTFSRLFFSLETSYFVDTPGVIWLRNLVTQFLSQVEICSTIRQLGNTLEKQLYKQKSCLFFPMNRCCTAIITPVGETNHFAETLKLWSDALSIAYRNRETIKLGNLETLARHLFVIKLPNIENLDLNGTLFEVNNCDNLDVTVVGNLIQKNYSNIYE